MPAAFPGVNEKSGILQSSNEGNTRIRRSFCGGRNAAAPSQSISRESI
jgi:hypothetical protein